MEQGDVVALLPSFYVYTVCLYNLNHLIPDRVHLAACQRIKIQRLAILLIHTKNNSVNSMKLCMQKSRTLCCALDFLRVYQFIVHNLYSSVTPSCSAINFTS